MLFLLFFLGEHYTTFSRPEAQDFQQQRLSVLTFFLAQMQYNGLRYTGSQQGNILRGARSFVTAVHERV